MYETRWRQGIMAIKAAKRDETEKKERKPLVSISRRWRGEEQWIKSTFLVRDCRRLPNWSRQPRIESFGALPWLRCCITLVLFSQFACVSPIKRVPEVASFTGAQEMPNNQSADRSESNGKRSMNLINTDFICEGRRFRRSSGEKRKIYRDPRSDFASIKSSLKVSWIYIFRRNVKCFVKCYFSLEWWH